LPAWRTSRGPDRRLGVEFLDFMNDIVAAYADTAIHVVLDNLNSIAPMRNSMNHN
jgi:hypothetical protein